MPDPKLSLFTCPRTGRRRARTYVPSDLRPHYKSSSISHGVYNIDSRDEIDARHRHLIVEFEALREGRTDVQHILQQRPRELTIAGLLRLWLEDVQSDLKAQRLSERASKEALRYAQRIAKEINFEHGNVLVKEFGRRHFKEIDKRLGRRGTASNPGKPIAHRTHAGYLKDIRSRFLNWAMEFEYISEEQFNAIKLAKLPRRADGRHRQTRVDAIPTEQDVKTIMETFDPRDPMYAIYKICLENGCRPTQVARMRWCDLQLIETEIGRAAVYHPKPVEGRTSAKGEKEGSPISPQLLNFIEQFRCTPEGKLKADTGYLFCKSERLTAPKPAPGVLDKDDLRKIHERHLRLSGVAPFPIKSIRNLVAGEAERMQAVTIAGVQSLLGHANPEMSRHYARRANPIPSHVLERWRQTGSA